MSEARLSVETCLAFAWRPADNGDSPPDLHGNLLLLRAVNALEGMAEPEAERHPERLETKLDLALHWLARVLHGSAALPRTVLRLDAEGIAWRPEACATPAPKARISLYPSALLDAPLDLPVTLVGEADGWLRASLDGTDSAFVEQWEQWLFRMHRRGIQATRGRPA